MVPTLNAVSSLGDVLHYRWRVTKEDIGFESSVTSMMLSDITFCGALHFHSSDIACINMTTIHCSNKHDYHVSSTNMQQLSS